ncbi:c-type cytochrome [Halomicronema sp. CCY15110]|uniref:c-type cytochrome n=1 Tax=Halomicronema sp. CCY15110 TaxID=2767773 RepID=UPI001EF280A9|nr:c-type cytochrome [Halomicronema sp. CCY15110]
MVRSRSRLGLWLLSLLCSWLLWMPLATATPVENVAEVSAPALFEANCAGCHVGGGNIVRRRKTLKQRALQRNGVDSVAAIADLITNGKGAMSAYRDRLTTAEIDQLAEYVWQQAQNNWP